METFEERRRPPRRKIVVPPLAEEEDPGPQGPLARFFIDELIIGQPVVVKSGKEATVFRCQAHPSVGKPWLAAKVYCPREKRNFKNDSVYQQGRSTGDRRLDRAIRNGSKTGRAAQSANWIGHEYGTLSQLYAAGADVPQPIACTGNALLMEYFGDSDAAAPQLYNVTLQPLEVQPLFQQLVRNLAICMDCDRVHGDLSAYNILYWQGKLQIIDFPQSVDPMDNPMAFALFARDVTNVCDYFVSYGVHADPYRLAMKLWMESGRARPQVDRYRLS